MWKILDFKGQGQFKSKSLKGLLVTKFGKIMLHNSYLNLRREKGDRKTRAYISSFFTQLFHLPQIICVGSKMWKNGGNDITGGGDQCFKSPGRENFELKSARPGPRKIFQNPISLYGFPVWLDIFWTNYGGLKLILSFSLLLRVVLNNLTAFVPYLRVLYNIFSLFESFIWVFYV